MKEMEEELGEEEEEEKGIGGEEGGGGRGGPHLAHRLPLHPDCGAEEGEPGGGLHQPGIGHHLGGCAGVDEYCTVGCTCGPRQYLKRPNCRV